MVESSKFSWMRPGASGVNSGRTRERFDGFIRKLNGDRAKSQVARSGPL
jgi:hypothetical protein